MKTNRILPFLIAASIFCGGCKSVKTILNEQKVSSEAEQELALATNSANLALVNSCDLNVNIGETDFNSLAVPVLEKDINQLKIGAVKSYAITKLATSTSDEQINFSADFQLSTDTLDASVKGKLIGTISFAFKNNSMILYPAFKYAHITDLTFKKANGLERKVVAGLLNVVISTFLEKLNGFIVSKTPSIPLNILDKQLVAGDIVNSPKVTATLSQPIIMSTPSFNSSCLINKSGIHILASFGVTPSLTKESPPKFSGKDFQKFENDYNNKKNTCFAKSPKDDSTYTLLSKASFSTIFNKAISAETISLKYFTDSAYSGKFDKNIKLNSNEIDCNKATFTCPQLHIVPGCAMPDFGDCGSCSIFNPICQAQLAVCLSKVAAEKGAWISVGLPTCLSLQASEIAFNASVKTACLTAQATAIGSCAIIKKSLQTVLTDSISVGDIHATVLANATATAAISGINVNSDLTQFNMSSQINVNSTLQTTFEFTPEGPAGHLVCFLAFDHPYDCSASTSLPLMPLKVSSTFGSPTNGVLNLNFQTDSQKIELNISPTPLILMNKDIATILNCPLLGLGLGSIDIVKGFKDLFLKGDFLTNTEKAIVEGNYEYTLKSQNFTLPIKPIQILLNESKITLKPLAGENYIGFYK